MREDEKDFLEESFRKEVLKAMDEKLSEKQKKELMEEAKVTLDFLEKIDEVELPNDNYVIFTDGKDQLLYENGEYYVISTTDSLRKKEKKTKKQATDMYLDFFIKYQLNPILDLRSQKKDIELDKTKQKQLEKIAQEIKVDKEEIEQKQEKEEPLI